MERRLISRLKAWNETPQTFMDFILIIRPLLCPTRLHVVRMMCIATVRMRLGLSWLLESAHITDASFHVPGLNYEYFGVDYVIPAADLEVSSTSEQWWLDHKNLNYQMIQERYTKQ